MLTWFEINYLRTDGNFLDLIPRSKFEDVVKLRFLMTDIENQSQIFKGQAA